MATKPPFKYALIMLAADNIERSPQVDALNREEENMMNNCY